MPLGTSAVGIILKMFPTLYETICDFTAQLMVLPIIQYNDYTKSTTEIFSSSGDSVINTIQGSVGNITANIQSSLISLGYALAIMFFIFQLIELSISERLTLETFIKSFAKLAVGIFFVGNASILYEYIKQFGEAFTSLISKAGGYTGGAATLAPSDIQAQLSDAMIKMCKENGELLWLPFFVMGVIVAIIGIIGILILKIIAYVICITRIIELEIRAAFLPIAFALLSDDGWKGSGGRYIRKFFAICAQAGCIVLIGKIASGINSAILVHITNAMKITSSVKSALALLGAVLSGYIIMFAVGFAIIAVMFKSLQIVNDAFGAY